MRACRSKDRPSKLSPPTHTRRRFSHPDCGVSALVGFSFPCYVPRVISYAYCMYLNTSRNKNRPFLLISKRFRKENFHPCPADACTVISSPRVHTIFSSFAFCGGQVHQWARTSPEIRAVLATDLLLYDFSVAVFRQQTAESLGTQWEA